MSDRYEYVIASQGISSIAAATARTMDFSASTSKKGNRLRIAASAGGPLRINFGDVSAGTNIDGIRLDEALFYVNGNEVIVDIPTGTNKFRIYTHAAFTQLVFTLSDVGTHMRKSPNAVGVNL